MVNVRSIKAKLIFSLLGIMGGAYLFLALVITPRIEEANIQAAGRVQEAMAGQLADNLDAAFESAREELESMAELPAVRSLDREQVDRAIRAFNASNRFFNYYFVMDPEGRWISYPTRPDLVGMLIPRRNMAWVHRTLEENRTVFLDVVRSRIGTLVSGFSTPVRGPDGTPAAVLRGVFVVSEENTLLRLLREVKVGDNGYAVLLSSNGWLLAHPRETPKADGFRRFRYDGHAPAAAALRGESGLMAFTDDGEPSMVAFRPVPATGWAVLFQQPRRDIVAGARREARMMSQVFLAMFALILVVAGLVIQLALRPLTRLLREMQTDGLSALTRVYPRDEIGQLARRFEELYTKLYGSREQLARSESKFRTLFDSTNDEVIIHDLEGRILEVNRMACVRLGFDREELVRLDLYRLDSPSSAPMIRERIREIRELGHLLFEAEHLTREGRAIPVEINARLIEFEDRPAILSVARDLSERKATEQALRREKERFQVLVERSPFALALVDREQRIEYVNPRFVEIFGYTLEDVPTIGEWLDRAHPDPARRREAVASWEQAQAATPLGGTVHRTSVVRCKDGSDKEVQLRLAPLETGERLIFLEDVSERKRLETQFQQAQRMEALGTLAGGIAHDFNNLLMGIQGRTSLLMAETDPGPGRTEHLRGIESHVKSAAELTQQLLGLARRGKYQVRPTDLNRLVQSSAEMFGRTKKEIRIHLKLRDDLPVAEVDQGQIEQVLLNLYVNAWQAMPAGGELYLETCETILDAPEAEPRGVVPGRFVRISVSDTGVGMDREILARIFDPFFTTKEMGRGTGLGLASAYGIVKNHGGYIDVQSEKGHGATFHVSLPASDETTPRSPDTADEAVHGSGTVLLVDDEEMVLEVGGRMLEHLGYEVVPAGSGEEAIRQVRERGERFDLVILDMIMPAMGGGETFDRLQEIAPRTPVLLSSGYSIDGEATEILSRGCRGFIQKPFDLVELSTKVAAALETPET